MVEHNVPIHQQDDGSEDCGPVSTLMILDYFGKSSDRDEVLKKVQRSDFGTSTFANAITLKKYGLDTTLVTIQPKIFYGEFLKSKPNKIEIIQRIKEQRKEEKDKDKKENLTMLISYVQSGGKLKLAIPTKTMLTEALESGKIIWASTYTRILGKDEGNHHAIVLAGYKNNKFLVLNPWPRSRKRSWEDANSIIFAIHSVTDFGYDNGAVIIVGR